MQTWPNWVFWVILVASPVVGVIVDRLTTRLLNSWWWHEKMEAFFYIAEEMKENEKMPKVKKLQADAHKYLKSGVDAYKQMMVQKTGPTTFSTSWETTWTGKEPSPGMPVEYAEIPIGTMEPKKTKIPEHLKEYGALAMSGISKLDRVAEIHHYFQENESSNEMTRELVRLLPGLMAFIREALEIGNKKVNDSGDFAVACQKVTQKWKNAGGSITVYLEAEEKLYAHMREMDKYAKMGVEMTAGMMKEGKALQEWAFGKRQEAAEALGKAGYSVTLTDPGSGKPYATKKAVSEEAAEAKFLKAVMGEEKFDANS